MSRRVLAAAGVLSILACETRSRTPDTASAYADKTVAHTLLGTELQAKPLIPAMRNQLSLLADQPPDRLAGNLTAHKHRLATLITAMKADAQRLGGHNVAAISALGDSAVDDLGGGTGEVAGRTGGSMDSVALHRHIARVERLIDLYETTVREAANRPTR